MYLTYTKNNGSKCPLCRQAYGNQNINCNLSGDSFYGKPRGTKLDCGHYYRIEPKGMSNLLIERYASNKIKTVKCLRGYIQKI